MPLVLDFPFRLFLHGFLDPPALSLHHFLEDPHLLVEVLALGLEGLDLLVVQLIPHEDFVVESGGLFPFVAADILRVLLGQLHCAVQPVQHFNSYLLLLLLGPLLRLDLVAQGRAILLADR